MSLAARKIDMTLSIRRVLWCLVALAFGAGCSKSGSPGPGGGRHPYTHPHELRFSAAAEIQQLNPLINESAYEEYLASMTMAWLIKTDRDGSPAPELATEVPSQRNGGISADGKTITWHLRRNVVWSDGAPFDADDVVYTTRQVLNPANNVLTRDGWELIDKIDEPDKYTVVYHLKQPYSSFAITFFSCVQANPAVLPKHLLARYPNLNNVPYNSLPVGIGPFKYSSWKRGDSVTLVANDRYFRGRPKLDRIVFKLIQDRNVVVQQLRTHDLDLFIPVSAHYFPEVRKIPGIATSSVPSFTFDHLDFNLSHPIMADPAVRTALRYATDRRTVIDKVQNGLYIQTETPVSPASSYHLDIPLVPYDPVKANAILDAAGWRRGSDGIRVKSGRRLSLAFASAIGTPDADTEIELLRGWWKQIGIEFSLKQYLLPQFFAPASDGGVIYGGKFDAVIFGWGIDPGADLSGLYACYRIPPNGQNDMHWCDRDATAAMDGAKLSYDHAVRKRDIDLVQRQLFRAAPTVILDVRKQLAAYNDDLKNWHPNSLSPFDDMMNVDI